MKYVFRLGMATAVFLMSFSNAAFAEEFVGIVKSLKGQASVKRANDTMDASVGMEIKVGDTVRTGADGSMAMIFSDDTIITMGARTELVVDAYLFEPIEGRLGFVTSIVRGTISYLSGQIEKLSPGTVQLKTPAATIGVRGTYVLVKVAP
jgi:hypothetical protein